MTLIFPIVGIFSGIAICIGTLHSIAQAIMERGRTRAIHVFAVVAMGGVMWCLLVRDAAAARMLAPALLLACALTFATERGWYKILPLIQSLFAFLVLMGFVRFDG